MTDERLIELLANAVDFLASHIEELGCTCGSSDQRTRFHAPRRRRRDSACSGIALAVEHRNLVRRARIRLKRRKPKLDF